MYFRIFGTTYYSGVKTDRNIQMTENYFRYYQKALTDALNGLDVKNASGQRLDVETGFEILCKFSLNIQSHDRSQYLCGNGASASLCNHMALDWTKNGKVTTRSFSNAALLTAVANDMGVEDLFSLPLSLYAGTGDLLVAISSSGNSPNIVRAIDTARELSMKVVTLSGLGPDNKIRQCGDLNFFIPARTYGMVECSHAVLMHAWLDRFMEIREWDRDVVQNMRRGEYQI
jgi:D-sedoheptulose 7-phosphate isomerase